MRRTKCIGCIDEWNSSYSCLFGRGQEFAKPYRCLLSIEAGSLSSLAILLVTDLFHPVHGFAFEGLLDGDVGHRGRRGGTVPVLFAGWQPDDVAGADFFDGSAPALDPAAASGHDESLAQRVGVPGGASAGLEGNNRAGDARGVGSLEG